MGKLGQVINNDIHKWFNKRFNKRGEQFQGRAWS